MGGWWVYLHRKVKYEKYAKQINRPVGLRIIRLFKKVFKSNSGLNRV